MGGWGMGIGAFSRVKMIRNDFDCIVWYPIKMLGIQIRRTSIGARSCDNLEESMQLYNWYYLKG